MNWHTVYQNALGYDAFLEKYGSEVHRERWRAFYERVSLSGEQKQTLGGFVRDMNVLCLAGAWCGDCVNQCPILQRFAEASAHIALRFVDRDVDPLVREELSVNGGQRVPVVVFLSEDFYECGRYGDRTLSTYRQMAASQLGAACPTGIGGTDQSLTEWVTRDWLDEFERIQLMLRLSARLRQQHDD